MHIDFLLSIDIQTIKKLINSIGLLFDICGAWFVAWEVLFQYRGQKHCQQQTWNEIFAGPRETDGYKKYEKNKYLKMWIGLSCLTIGFLLQIISNFPVLVRKLIE